MPRDWKGKDIATWLEKLLIIEDTEDVPGSHGISLGSLHDESVASAMTRCP